jgi:hypothetical protein
MTVHGKRTLSLTVFSLLALCGLYGCVRLPVAVFTIGDNDSLPEIWAFLLPATLLPTAIAAFWGRKYASIWLIILGAIWIFGEAWQSHYMARVKHFPKDSLWTLMLGGFIPAYLVIGGGVFGLYTDRRGWPKIIGTDQPDVNVIR